MTTGTGPHDPLDGGIRDDAIPPVPELSISRRIELLVQPDPVGDLAVPVRVHDGRTPPLRLFGIACLVVDPCVDPADDVAHRAQIEHVVVVEPELQVMRVEAGIDQLDLFGCWIEIRQLSGGVH